MRVFVMRRTQVMAGVPSSREDKEKLVLPARCDDCVSILSKANNSFTNKIVEVMGEKMTQTELRTAENNSQFRPTRAFGVR